MTVLDKRPTRVCWVVSPQTSLVWEVADGT